MNDGSIKSTFNEGHMKVEMKTSEWVKTTLFSL